MWKKPSTMGLSKELSLFMAREDGGEREGSVEAKISRPILMEKRGGGGGFFLMHYFSEFFWWKRHYMY